MSRTLDAEVEQRQLQTKEHLAYICVSSIGNGNHSLARVMTSLDLVFLMPFVYVNGD